MLIWNRFSPQNAKKKRKRYFSLLENASWFRERKAKSLQGNLVLIMIVFRMKRKKREWNLSSPQFSINEYELGLFLRFSAKQLQAHCRVACVAQSWVIDVHKFNLTDFCFFFFSLSFRHPLRETSINCNKYFSRDFFDCVQSQKKNERFSRMKKNRIGTLRGLNGIITP